MKAEELLHYVSKGDAVAFGQLYELLKGRVYNTCLSYLQNTAEAEEATQDVFVEVHRRAGDFKGNAAVTTWVYRITINKCIDRIRHGQRKKRFGIVSSLFSKETGEAQQHPPVFEHPGIIAENKERAKLLFAAIAQLPDNQRAAFVLKHIEQLSQKEVAYIMEVGEKAVESLLQRAKANLRKALGDMYHETKD